MVESTTRVVNFTTIYNAGEPLDDRNLESELDNIIDTLDELLVTVTSEPASIGRGNTRMFVDPVAGIDPILYVGDQDGDARDILTTIKSDLVNLSGSIAPLLSGSAIVSGDIVIKTLQTSGGSLVSAIPSGYLECDGSAVNRTTYSNLYTAISDQFGEGDGSTTFNIPDMRGMFPRGWDHGAGTDPDAGTRTAQNTGGNTGDNVGSEQDSQNKSHTHTLSGYEEDSADHPGSITVPRKGAGSGLISTVSSGGDEARPKNLNFVFCIKT